MATHYNEPVDVASSSLTEEGAVFGGEKNLVKGLDNLIRLYDPEVIGISTTCLAETIGEDTAGIVARYAEARPDLKAKIITVQSAGYEGTQFEGFFRTLRALVEQVEPDFCPNGKINIVTNMISPADTRWLKDLVAGMGLSAIFLPDLSENLDGGIAGEYERLPSGGVSLAEIGEMAGARATVEISSYFDEAYSPGAYLEETYGVPLHRTGLPVSLADMDALIALLEQLGGKVTERIRAARARRLDAMVDGHKYNAQVRAAVFGEPDFVLAVSRLLTENGALTAVAACGGPCAGFAAPVREALAEVETFHLGENPVILEAADFSEIEEVALAQGVNVLVGSSDGRRISEKTGIPLVRCAFPVHDFVGGQRVRTLGYEGGLALLDQITNAVIGGIESRFRGELKARYFRVPGKSALPDAADGIRRIGPAQGGLHGTVAVLGTADVAAKGHPCFCECSGARGARIHLPVAPACNISCGYCIRKYDCVNESRPGVTSMVLSPQAALERYLLAKEKIEDLTVVGIAGPGDALANPEQTLETLRLIREVDKDVLFCVSTNGLALPQYVDELADLGLSHLTVTVNAVNVQVGARIYRYVDFLGERYTGTAAAALLLANQWAGLLRARALGMAVKINTVMLPGINDGHLEEIARAAKDAGCVLHNIMPHIPVAGSALARAGAADGAEVDRLRAACERHLPQMRHCAHCRADAAGPLGHDVNLDDSEEKGREDGYTEISRVPVYGDETARRRERYVSHAR
jgi:nitrogenase cofactor biosynthesis protein NifB